MSVNNEDVLLPRLNIIWALLVPLIIISIYTAINRWINRWDYDPTSYILFQIIATMVGTISIIDSPLKLTFKLAWLISYIPLMFGFIPIYTVIFACNIYGDCL